jgi:cytochrome c
LFEYLKNPRAVIPGTTMAFAGIPDPQKRADVIAYIKASAAS